MAVDRSTNVLRALSDEFDVQEEIGRGGAAIVYRARRRSDGVMVAIKMMRPEIVGGVTSKRFLLEIALESQFEHPLIVSVLSSGELEGTPYFVMPLCTGESLRTRLDREGELPLAEVVRITGDVAAALSHAHARGVIHRDIKPENIMLEHGHALVVDFGIARALTEAGDDRLTESGVAIGTLPYMSPEQAGGDRRLDPRSDIYSLACVVYEMLSGDPPFTGKSAQAIVARHLGDAPTSIRIIRRTLPTGVDYALTRALAKSPADRFASAEEFAAALQAPPPEGWSPAPLPPRSSSFARAGVGAAVMVGTALMMWLLIWPPAPDADPNRVVLFPLSDGRAAASEAGWDVALAINSSLEHAQPLRGIDGWQYLSPAVRADADLLTNQLQRRIARERGARYYMTGAITRRGDSATVKVDLYDAVGDTVVGSESELGAGDAASVASAGLRASALLLPILLDPGRRIDLTALLDRNPGAIALWLQGEREYRRSHFREALELLRRAVGEDSLLAVAAVRGAQAASWQSETAIADRLIAVALSHQTLLGPASASLAKGFQAYSRGAADSAVRFLETARMLMPEDAAPSMLLGEVFHHLMPSVRSADSLADAMFREAVRRDTAFTPALVHLAERALLTGDITAAQAPLARLRLARSDSTLLRQLTLMEACARGRPRVDWDAAARTNVEAVILAGQRLAVRGRQAECAKGAFRATMAIDTASAAFRWYAFLGLQGLLVSQGRGDEARQLLDSAMSAGTLAVMALYPIALVAGAPTAGRGPQIAAFADSAYGDGYERSSFQTRWVLALWHASQGDAEMVARIAASLTRQADSTGRRRDLLIAAAARAHALLARADTAAAIAAFQALRPTAPRESLLSDLFESLAVERITLARLLLARGDNANAFDVAATMDHPQPVMNLLFLRESLAIRQRAAQQMGRERAAANARTRYRALDVMPK